MSYVVPYAPHYIDFDWLPTGSIFIWRWEIYVGGAYYIFRMIDKWMNTSEWSGFHES